MNSSPRKTPATYDDANLLLRLYELRREDRMRAARAWFASKYHAANLEEAMTLGPPGSEENASFRMVTSYWDMVASYITAGVLNADLFFESNRELLLVWIRIKPIIPEIRAAFGDPCYLHSLEEVGENYAIWLNSRAPGSFEAFAKRMG
ncbi:MAG: hypothetical protein U5J83_01045 [Bryobacterales bacterium]|nr:hypothetical protein [Bryobacterales bacterium]